MKTSQQTWLSRLLVPGDDQQDALNELRRILEKRIRIAFQHEKLVDDAFIDDAIQESMLKILSSLDQFQGRSKFTTWATTIAVRAVYTELRRRVWKNISLDEVVKSQGELAISANQESLDHPSEELKRLVDMMYSVIRKQLTKKQRDALLAELAGVPLEEIGRRMGSNRNAIYKLTHDARKKLKQELETLGFTHADFWELQEQI